MPAGVADVVKVLPCNFFPNNLIKVSKIVSPSVFRRALYILQVQYYISIFESFGGLGGFGGFGGGAGLFFTISGGVKETTSAGGGGGVASTAIDGTGGGGGGGGTTLCLFVCAIICVEIKQTNSIVMIFFIYYFCMRCSSNSNPYKKLAIRIFPNG
jgi:hypothetical protein